MAHMSVFFLCDDIWHKKKLRQRGTTSLVRVDPYIVKKQEVWRIGSGLSYLWKRVLKERLYVAEKTGWWSEFQSLEVIGINKVANVFVRLVSNLIAKGGWILKNRVFSANEAFESTYISRLINCISVPIFNFLTWAVC